MPALPVEDGDGDCARAGEALAPGDAPGVAAVEPPPLSPPLPLLLLLLNALADGVRVWLAPSDGVLVLLGEGVGVAVGVKELDGDGDGVRDGDGVSEGVVDGVAEGVGVGVGVDDGDGVLDPEGDVVVVAVAVGVTVPSTSHTKDSHKMQPASNEKVMRKTWTQLAASFFALPHPSAPFHTLKIAKNKGLPATYHA